MIMLIGVLVGLLLVAAIVNFVILDFLTESYNCCAGNNEPDVVQNAMDIMLTDKNLIGVTPREHPLPGNNSWTVLPLGRDGTTSRALSPIYLKQATSKFYYCWNDAGLVTVQDPPEEPGTCP